ERFQDRRRDLEVEPLLRTDLENEILSLKEQLDFQSRLFDECERLIEHAFNIQKAVEGCKQAEYESQLPEELRSIRDQSASELEGYKIQVEGIFRNKRE
ncbi:hypothetical protein Smp_117880, partial [Schistosoma mansoni]|uniref:hypothetical protein n=1 Tax=Schistosoma mansoni TaxID=6183 RepID=UPI0001A62DF2